MALSSIVPERFWAKVDRSNGGDACWLWTGYTKRNGYGSYTVGTRGAAVTRHVHRISYELTYGPIPPGACVCHHCDTPSCCNPRHLWIGTQYENLADMTAKGRRAKQNNVGADNNRARLTDADVRAITADTRRSQDIALQFHVSSAHVRAIKLRKAWRHLWL